MAHFNNNTPPALSTPCTLQQLRTWLQSVDVVGTGEEKAVTVSSTSSTITVS